MVAGAIGFHFLNVRSHVVEVHKHVIGIVTVQVLNMKEILVRGTGIRHDPVILEYAQVGTNGAYISRYSELNVCRKLPCRYTMFHTSFWDSKIVSITLLRISESNQFLSQFSGIAFYLLSYSYSLNVAVGRAHARIIWFGDGVFHVLFSIVITLIWGRGIWSLMYQGSTLEIGGHHLLWPTKEIISVYCKTMSHIWFFSSW